MLLKLVSVKKELPAEAPHSPSVEKQPRVRISPQQAKKVTGILAKQDDAYWNALFLALIRDPEVVFEGFPLDLKFNLVSLHRLRWMNRALSEGELCTVEAAVGIQIKTTIISQMRAALDTPESLSVTALQLLHFLSPKPLDFLCEEPYVRLRIRRAKVDWAVQQNGCVIEMGVRKAFIPESEATVDLTVAHFLAFKCAGKRTPTHDTQQGAARKVLCYQNADNTTPDRIDRTRPDRNVANKKGLKNHTVLFDVDRYSVLTAYRPNGVLIDFDLKDCFCSATRTRLPHKHDQAINNLVKLLKMKHVASADITSKDIFFGWLTGVFNAALVELPSQNPNWPNWLLTYFKGPRKIFPFYALLQDLATKAGGYFDFEDLTARLYRVLFYVRVESKALDGSHVQYDHIPQAAAIIQNQADALKSEKKYMKEADKEDLKNRAYAIAIPKWLHVDGASFGERAAVSLFLPKLFLRDVQSEWTTWCEPGKHFQEKEELHVSDFCVIGAYRYLARCFLRFYDVERTIFEPLEPHIGATDRFFVETLRALAVRFRK